MMNSRTRSPAAGTGKMASISFRLLIRRPLRIINHGNSGSLSETLFCFYLGLAYQQIPVTTERCVSKIDISSETQHACFANQFIG